MVRTVEVDIGNGTIAQITRPDRDDFPSNLGGAVQYALANVLTWLAETSGGAIGAFGGSALVSFLEHIEPGLVEYYKPLIDMLLDVPEMPDGFRVFLEQLKSPTSEAGAAVVQSVIGSAAGGITGSLLGAALSGITYQVNRAFTPARPVLPDLVAMNWRGTGEWVDIQSWMLDQGWTGIQWDMYQEVLRPRPGIPDLISWAWRVHQDPEVIRGELTERGYLTESIDQIMELAKRLPGPGDLVTFALREVWRPDIRPELLKPDAPAKYYELMEKQGFDREFAEDYWASHWRLPSAAQGFEMFWRLPEFTKADLKQLLVRLDILPAYQDELIKIAYRPITRVDVRRMHATGQISDTELLTRYGDIGFSPTDAAEMAEFTIRYNAGTEVDYTKTEILKAYRLGMIDAVDAVALFEDIGKSRDYAIFLLSLEEYKWAAELLEQETDIIEDRYVQHEIDTTAARSRLMGLNLKATHVDRLLEEWGIARRAKIALPTRANLEEFYKDGIISEAQAREELWKRRYPEYTIAWWIRDWDEQIVEAARKEAERAQAEQERMAKARFKTDRSMALAILNRQIAEQKLMIAELKVSAFYAETDEQVAAIKENILILKASIAGLQLEKAELPVVLEERG